MKLNFKKEYLLPLSFAVVGAFMLIESPVRTIVQEIPKSSYRRLQSQGEGGDTTKKAFTALSVSPYVAPPVSFKKPYKYFKGELKRLKGCLKTQNCKEFSQEDARSYEVGVHRETTRTLSTLNSWVKRHQYQDERLPYLMSGFLTFDSSEVKEQALEIMATQPLRRKNLGSILKHVIGNSNPDSVVIGLQELTRFDRPSEQKKVDDYIEGVLLRGNLHTAVEIAENLGPLLNTRNMARYRSILLELQKTPISEDVYIALNKTLREQ